MQCGRGKTMFLAACLLKIGFWMGQESQSPYPLAETRAASHAVELKQIVTRGVRTEQDQEVAKAACAAVLVECWMEEEW